MTEIVILGNVHKKKNRSCKLLQYCGLRMEPAVGIEPTTS